MAQIDFFKNNKNWYSKHGKPIPLVYIHLKPGYGKTILKGIKQVSNAYYNC